ncbi:MAG: nucleotidyltransferase [Gemmatimonadales bacterium]|nr:nucleotidyltransferase [Gemmatimonadales bacterium]
MSAIIAPVPASTDLDAIVAEVCLTLQISPTQFELARGHYVAVEDWLSREGSPLERLSPRVYPQGGMALRTTVKPREREEFDLDIVLQVEPVDSDPIALYEDVADRLEASDLYRPKLERMKRCLRLNYEHQFHLDILPARRDAVRGSTCIEVPDTKLECWKPSNPLGFVGWFELCCDGRELLKALREQAPLLPALAEAQLKVLRQAVQLTKRRRDNAFGDSDTAPRSVVLTTLAGTYYVGGSSLTAALEQILLGIENAIAVAHPNPIEVRNPTNLDELFSETWSNPAHYQTFTKFIRKFRQEITALRQAEGLDEIGQMLDAMFGDGMGEKALRAYGEQLGSTKAAGELRFGAPAIIVGGQEGRKSPPHTFHHRAR